VADHSPDQFTGESEYALHMDSVILHKKCAKNDKHVNSHPLFTLEINIHIQKTTKQNFKIANAVPFLGRN